MEDFQFLVFDKLNLKEYNIIDTNWDNLIEDMVREVGITTEGNSTDTSSWMNRFPCLTNNDKSYIIIPAFIPSYNDIVKATMGKYAILLHRNNDFEKFTTEDIKHFQENFPYEFDIKKRENKQKETEEQYARLLIRDSFRIPLAACSDDTIKIIRFLIINNKQEIFNELVIGGIDDDTDVLSNIFNKIKEEIELQDISISSEKFAREIKLFFCPEIYFAPMGLGVKESIILYFSLCVEGSWLRELFLRISEKEVIDSFNEFIGKDKNE